jgi:ATP-dependent helicase/DNAse subunit B
MQALTGRPGSGKTSYVLDQVRNWLRQRAEFRLIVPTNTMAEHLRNQLAREGFVFRPAAIVTFSKFVELLLPDLPRVSPAALELLLEEALRQVPLQKFAKVRDYPGFSKSVVDQIQELAAAGYSSRDLRRSEHRSESLDEFTQLFERAESDVARKGWHFPAQRLRRAAERVQSIPKVIFHGFFTFTRPELEIVAALGKVGEVLITLPSWKGSDETMTALRRLGCEEIQCAPGAPADVARVLVTSSTGDQEAEEIARRILAEHDAGRPFREMGIIVRSEHPGGDTLRCALERFGIPARFYFGEPLSRNAVVTYLAAVVEAMLGGWEHSATIGALRKAGPPLNVETDEFEYRVRNALPGKGLPALRTLASGKYERFLRQLESLDTWRSAPATAIEWAARFRVLTGLFPAPKLRDQAPPEWLGIWRSQAAALAGFEAAVDELGGILDPSEVLACSEYWSKLKTVIDANTLRIPDNRRNVVHVIDAYEARQWQLPVVFLCGLLEKHFPKHHSESPLLSDKDRHRLRESGVHLRTTYDRHEEEQFLFELATSRATSKLVLSYPLLNAKGDANLPSFFLEKIRQQCEVQPSVRIRPVPARPLRPVSIVSIYDEVLRDVLKTRHGTISATSLESFLQCPFQFFAKSTLQLQDAPLKPEDRLNQMLQGSIAHTVLQRMYSTGESLEVAFASAWDENCRKNRVPLSYRAEAVRMELLRNLGTFTKSTRLPRTQASEFERSFKIQLDGGALITARVDRIDIDEQGRALVIDYKYKREKGIKDLVTAHDQGQLVQGGLYLHAMRAEGYQPAGMIYAGFRREASFGGWVENGAFPGLNDPCTTETLNEVVRHSVDVALTAIGQIYDGRIATAPANLAKCDYCSYEAACRVETIAAQKLKKGAAE